MLFSVLALLLLVKGGGCEEVEVGGDPNPFWYEDYLYEKEVNVVSKMYRSKLGSFNNYKKPFWGMAGNPLKRVVPPSVEDQQLRSGVTRPSPRTISNDVCDSTEEQFEPDPRNLSSLFVAWGQFFTHDLDNTPFQTGQSVEEWPIEVPLGDPYFDKESEGNKTIPFIRSIFTKPINSSTRQQINLLSSWFDGELIYGGNSYKASQLRTYKGGKMKLDNDMLIKQGGLFIAGDDRVNENIVLTSLNTLFVREHNRICEQISNKYGYMSDPELFNYAKNYVSALIAKITYDDYLPLLIGEKLPYTGYDKSIDPSVSNVFSTVALRFGHFTVPFHVLKMDQQGKKEEIKVRDSVRNPSLLFDAGEVGKVLKGESHNLMKKRSIKMSNELRNFLVHHPHNRDILLDLAAINIQRGRDHGLPHYNAFRKAFDLPEYQSFQEFTSDPRTLDKLQRCFGTIDKLDAFVGIIGEQSLPDAAVGELGKAVIKDTMLRVREGDRLWYERVFPPTILREIKQTTLAHIIKRNTQIKSLKEDVFMV